MKGQDALGLVPRALGSVPADLGRCEELTLQGGWCADVATAVTAALVAPGTLLVEVAQVHARALLPGDGAHSHSACKVITELGDTWPGAPHHGALHGSHTCPREGLAGRPGFSPPGMSMQMWSQPLVVHRCPREHCESAWHSSTHWPSALSSVSAGAPSCCHLAALVWGWGKLPPNRLCPLPLGTATHSQPQPVSQHFSSRWHTLSSRHCLPRRRRVSQHGSARGHSPGCSARGGDPGEGGGPSPAHTSLPWAGGRAAALTLGRAGAVHGAAREAAFLLPGAVPVVAAGVHLRARLPWVLWPHLWALAGFVWEGQEETAGGRTILYCRHLLFCSLRVP